MWECLLRYEYDDDYELDPDRRTALCGQSNRLMDGLYEVLEVTEEVR
jgi:hypothetical protein